MLTVPFFSFFFSLFRDLTVFLSPGTVWSVFSCQVADIWWIQLEFICSGICKNLKNYCWSLSSQIGSWRANPSRLRSVSTRFINEGRTGKLGKNNALGLQSKKTVLLGCPSNFHHVWSHFKTSPDVNSPAESMVANPKREPGALPQL